MTGKGSGTLIDFDKLAADMGDLNEQPVLETARRVAEEEPESAAAVLRALTRGMEIVGERFNVLEYFVGDLIFAGEIFSEALEILRPAFPEPPETDRRKKVILATVEGDLHDIGKNIVRLVLLSRGFEVIDLGVNASPAAIVQKTLEEGARIVALSGVLSFALDSMERTIEALSEAGIRDRVTVVVGGSCVNEKIARKIGADAYGRTPEDTAAICLAVE